MLLNSISICSDHFFPLLQEKVTLSLTEVQKRTVLIAAAALALLAACYLAKYCFFDRYFLSNVKSVDDDKEEDYTLFEQAMELMFQDRKFEWGKWIDPLTDEQKKERHEQLKKIIPDIPKAQIDLTIDYRDGMMDRSQTLLLQAIMNLPNPEQRLEIVELLLAQGADPLGQGFYYAEVDPLEEAKNTKDIYLIQLFENVIKNRNPEAKT